MEKNLDNVEYLALSGGVGGAKLVLGLSQILAPEKLIVVANTADDFKHIGLNISPDLDTIMYTLANLNNSELGWGQKKETWQFLEALGRLDQETWFKIGDRDLATHIVRTTKLDNGSTLSQVTKELCLSLGVKHQLIPMTNDKVATVVHTKSGQSIPFQQYFVRDRCVPKVRGFEFQGIATAAPSSSFLKSLKSPKLRLIIICPSNPYVSIDPILRMSGVLDQIAARRIPVIAISPIISGQALKGPAAKMMEELGESASAIGIAKHYQTLYRDMLTGFIIDEKDCRLEPDFTEMGLRTIATNTVMVTLQDRINLAQEVLRFGSRLNI